MFIKSTNLCKMWSKFSVKKADTTLKCLIQDLPKNRIKEYLDFKVNQFMKYERFHQAAGILEIPKAVKEYLTFLNEYLDDNLKGVTICCTDEENDNSKIVGISAMKLVTFDDLDDLAKYYNKAKTKEVAKFFEYFMIMDDIYPVTEMMKKYGLERYYDDTLGIGVHTEYRGLGICQQFGISRQIMCKEHNVPACGAWVTSDASQVAAERIGWETVFQISGEDVERRLGVTFKDTPKYVKYIIRKI